VAFRTLVGVCAAVVWALATGAGEAHAQSAVNRVVVDSIAITGSQRVIRSSIVGSLGFVAGDTITPRDIQRAQKTLWETRQFSDVQVYARGTGAPDDPAIIDIVVEEAPLVRRVDVRGLERASADVVEDSAGITTTRPLEIQRIAIAERAIRSSLASNGIPFARIETRLEPVAEMDNVIDLVIEVEEGERVSIAEFVVEGNENVSTEEIVSVLSSKPEGFFWFRTGTYEQDRYENDLTQAIPRLYRSRGFLDFEIVSDTLIIDPESGKARVELAVSEGPQYRVAQLTIEGNREFEDEQLEQYFLPQSGGLLSTLGLSGNREEMEQQGRVFDAIAFEGATAQIGQLYANEGFIFADVSPSIEKQPPLEEGGDPTVALNVSIIERTPAFIGSVNIVGNDYTYDRVIRERITVLPGDVYSQDRIIQSIQAIDGLGFFEPANEPPDIQVDPETGEVDVTFKVQERQTGSINFGTSIGGGVGLSGFIGYEQPNLFGQAKSGSVRWDFGRFLNSFTLGFTDPALFQTRTSGTIQLFNTIDRFFQFSSGRRRRVGGSLRFGFPVPGALRTRVFTGYSISRTRLDLFENAQDNSLFGRPDGTLSQFQLGIQRTTLNSVLFPVSGSNLSWDIQLNGGLLGGDGNFTKQTFESELWAPVWTFGGDRGSPTVIALGTSLRGGAIIGNSADFPFERFWMGGVQFGERLRGYDETSVTPFGFFPENSRQIRDIDRLGNAYLVVSTELALRLSQQFSLHAFYDAGNVWTSFDQVNPAELFRGAGLGATVVTPFGPIGLDYGYGFDKDLPGWQFHFTFGQGF
jgi:outer membrane protein insertion porin family